MAKATQKKSGSDPQAIQQAEQEARENFEPTDTVKQAQDDPTVNTEEAPPYTDEGQVHPATGNPAQLTQEGRDIRDASQQFLAFRRILDRGIGNLSDIQRQKLDSHPALKGSIEDKRNKDELLSRFQEAKSDQERAALVVEALGGVTSEEAIALLREPEDPNADPTRDLQEPVSYRTA